MANAGSVGVVRPSRGGPGPDAIQDPGMSRDERYAAGKAMRKNCPRESHASWAPKSRRDPVDLVLAANKGRLPNLLPLRHGRMVRSPFTFYCGAALNMAADLAVMPTTGIRLECCGDAHLVNFGGFATPEGRVIFAVNDLDETLPAPWEWDLKRLVASFVVACRDNSLSERIARDVVMTCVRTYRESMAEFSELKKLELWHQSMPADELAAHINNPEDRARALKRLRKERAKSIAEDVFPKLVDQKGSGPVINDHPPTIFHPEGHPPGRVQQDVLDVMAGYRATIPTGYQSLLDEYELRDAAIKVVGIGSVGTACWVLLYMAGDGDPLFLQLKEARSSVLERYAGASIFPHHGQRVVNGYRRLQPASDMFLGWTKSAKRHYFVRQLRDVKISIRVETFGRAEMDIYARWCGRALALSHARSGLSAMLCGYMGKSEVLDDALAAFAKAYADQNERDHAALARAVSKGQVEATFEEDR